MARRMAQVIQDRDNPMDYLANAGKGAKWGFGFGAALPAAGSLAKGAYDAGSALFAPVIEGLGRPASALMRLAAKADGASAESLSKLGPDAMLPDTGPSMLGLAQGAATGVGPGLSALVKALEARNAATSQRLGETLDQHLGPTPVPSQVDAQIAGDLKNTALSTISRLTAARASIRNRLPITSMRYRLSYAAPLSNQSSVCASS